MKKSRQIAFDLDMSHRVVQKTIKLWQEIGDVAVDHKSTSRMGSRAMSGAEVEVSGCDLCIACCGLSRSQFLIALLERDPDLYLDEISEELESQHGIDVPLSTIWRTLTELGMSRKKVHFSLVQGLRNDS